MPISCLHRISDWWSPDTLWSLKIPWHQPWCPGQFPPLALVNHGLLIIPIHLILLYDSLSSPPVAGVWWHIHLIGSMTLSPLHVGVWWAHTLDWLYDSLSSPPVAGVWWELHWLALWLSLLSTCSWCVVSAYTWLALWLSLLSTCSWCVVSAYTWLALWLSLLSTCSWCVVSAYTWLALWLFSSPPVAGVWWEHTLDWLYDSLSPPVAGVWWAHTLDWFYDYLSSPPVAGVWWAHTLDWLYDSLSSPPVAGVWWAHTLDWLYDFSLSTCSWCVVSALAPLSCGSRHIIQVDAAHWWLLRREPPTWLWSVWVYNNTQ